MTLPILLTGFYLSFIVTLELLNLNHIKAFPTAILSNILRLLGVIPFTIFIITTVFMFVFSLPKICCRTYLYIRIIIVVLMNQLVYYCLTIINRCSWHFVLFIYYNVLIFISLFDSLSIDFFFFLI